MNSDDTLFRDMFSKFVQTVSVLSFFDEVERFCTISSLVSIANSYEGRQVLGFALKKSNILCENIKVHSEVAISVLAKSQKEIAVQFSNLNDKSYKKLIDYYENELFYISNSIGFFVVEIIEIHDFESSKFYIGKVKVIRILNSNDQVLTYSDRKFTI
jgi:flavin reductase (DIM6/NTAB) family NADH-FMN oxidoreductase RutF